MSASIRATILLLALIMSVFIAGCSSGNVQPTVTNQPMATQDQHEGQGATPQIQPTATSQPLATQDQQEAQEATPQIQPTATSQLLTIQGQWGIEKVNSSNGNMDITIDAMNEPGMMLGSVYEFFPDGSVTVTVETVASGGGIYTMEGGSGEINFEINGRKFKFDMHFEGENIVLVTPYKGSTQTLYLKRGFGPADPN